MPKNGLRKKFPAEGYTPAALSLHQHRTTALSDVRLLLVVIVVVVVGGGVVVIIPPRSQVWAPSCSNLLKKCNVLYLP